MNKPLKEHYENDIGHLAVYNYIEDLEKYIEYLMDIFYREEGEPYPAKEYKCDEFYSNISGDICSNCGKYKWEH